MLQVQTERVLVTPTEVFHRLGHFQGFCGDVERYLAELFNPRHTSFRPRDEVEEDPGFKQLIPYVIFQHAGSLLNRADREGVSVFQYRRGSGQGESRLHKKRSIGIGGHISAADAAVTGSDLYREGMRRELDEEVIVEAAFTERMVGLINDDETPVGRVHLGVVHIVEMESPAVRPRETDIAESGFRPVGELLAKQEEFETWSQICLEALFGRP